MKPVRIFRHVACEHPGYLAIFLERHAIPYEIVCVDVGVKVPQHIDDVSALVFMGGAMNVTDPLDWIAEEKKLIRHAVEHDVPVLGICLGAQLISAALGGNITHDDDMEIGWHDVELVKEQSDNDWFKHLPEKFTPFHWHADTFTIPEGATLLMHSNCRNNQAFVLNNTLAIQFHLEMTVEMVKKWVKLYGSDLINPHPCTQNPDEILEQLEVRINALHYHADKIFTQWVKTFAAIN